MPVEPSSIGAGQSTSQPTGNIILRQKIVATAKTLLGIKYYLGAEWTDYSKLPEALDCSEMVEGVYLINKLPMKDGAQNQFNFTVKTIAPQIGDLAFFGKNKDITKVYHVGILYDNEYMIEARGYDPEASFETGKVILRSARIWEKYQNFLGYRSHPGLV